MNKDQLSEAVTNWETQVRERLVGRTIKSVRYMTLDEMETLGWYSRAILLVLDDGEIIYPSQDDEGNNAGALFTTYDGLETIPVV